MLLILRQKFSPGQGFESGSPALRAGALPTAPPRRITGPSICVSSSKSIRSNVVSCDCLGTRSLFTQTQGIRK